MGVAILTNSIDSDRLKHFESLLAASGFTPEQLSQISDAMKKCGLDFTER